MSQYLDCLEKTLKYLEKFSLPIVVKFHPRETQNIQNKVKAKLANSTLTYQLCSDERPAEEIIYQRPPVILASFAAASLIYFQRSNIKSLYIFHLVEDLMTHQTFIDIKKILMKAGYQFIDSEAFQLRADFGFNHLDIVGKPITMYLNQ